MRKLYLAAYDVADEARLRYALRAARSFAIGGQKSVHECMISDAEMAELLVSIEERLDPNDDRFLLLRLDPRAKIFLLGRAIAPSLSDVLYFR